MFALMLAGVGRDPRQARPGCLTAGFARLQVSGPPAWPCRGPARPGLAAEQGTESWAMRHNFDQTDASLSYPAHPVWLFVICTVCCYRLRTRAREVLSSIEIAH